MLSRLISCVRAGGRYTNVQVLLQSVVVLLLLLYEQMPVLVGNNGTFRPSSRPNKGNDKGAR